MGRLCSTFSLASIQYIVDSKKALEHGNRTMTDDQEQLRQHWQQLAEQLGLDSPEESRPPSAPSPLEEKEPLASAAPVSKIENSTSKAEHRQFMIDAESPPEAESVEGFSLTASEPGPPEQPSGDPDDSVIEESLPNDRRSQRGRRDRRSDRDEQSSHSRQDSHSRRSEAESIQPEDREEAATEEESQNISESLEDTEPAILHDSASGDPESEEDDDIDDVDTLSDWNVPSWAELIGSLYRPER
jgi:hypothetical protein